jgi:hypothetical protein
MTPESGAAAAIFFARGLAELAIRLARTPGSRITSERHEEVRELLRTHLPWSGEDENELHRAVAVLDPRTADGLEEAETGIVFGVLRRVIGDHAARELPGLAPLFESSLQPSAYVTGLSWRIAAHEWFRQYLRLCDPEAEPRT